jgi:hypothetical protein
MKLIIITFFLVVASILPASSQEEHHEDGQQVGEQHDGSHHHIYDLGFAPSAVYNLTEKSTDFGLHLHLFRAISDKFALGIGYEAVFAEAQHHSITLLLKYEIIHNFTINLGPGLIFPNEEHDEYSLAGHIELVKTFELGGWHLGPMVGFGFDEHEKHLSFGLHIGYGF